jgi:hypothetical protein
MKENERLYPISEELFNEKVLPIIEANYIVNRIVQPTERWPRQRPALPPYRPRRGV